MVAGRSLRVVEGAGFYFPESLGGTEVYLKSLTKELRRHGIDTVIAAPSASTEASCYAYDGTDVFRYPVPERWLTREIQGRTPHRFFETFESWLYDQRADIYHQHSWTTGCGLWHLRAAKRLGLKTVVTVHVPGNVCMRGTMLLDGRGACDGEILPRRCASCWLQSKGLPANYARHLAALPTAFGPLARVPHVGPPLAARALATSRKREVEEMAAVADRVVAVCGWLHAGLRANGVPDRKLVLNRQGVRALSDAGPRANSTHGDVVRLGFLGRWDPLKGIDVLVDAFKRLPRDLKVTLDIRAADGGPNNAKYSEDVQRSAGSDWRIRFPAIQGEIFEFLAGLDVLIVPSQWMETGPLVVLEAFAAGIPVIGSDLGGIRELVSHERDGLLVAHNDPAAWTAALQRIVDDTMLRSRLRAGIGPVRTMKDASRETAVMYREMLARSADAA